MRRRAALVKLSTATTYKVRNLGDIGDAKCATAGLQPLKHDARFRLDFGIASTNVRAALTEKETRRTESDTIRSQQILPSRKLSIDPAACSRSGDLLLRTLYFLVSMKRTGTLSNKLQV
jgi:hypothetical protein